MQRLTRTRIALAVSTAWIIAIGWYWHTSIPLAADRVIQLPTWLEFRGFAPNGDAILVNTVREGDRGDGHTDVGPVEFWRLPELTRVREVFRPGDAIALLPATDDDRAVVVRDRQVWLANLKSGELLEALPGAETRRCNRLIHGDRLFWLRDQVAVVYDLNTKQTLASIPGQIALCQCTDRFICLQAALPVAGGFAPGDVAVFDMRTAERDQRFDFLGPLKRAEFSQDGSIAVLCTADRMAICDVSTAREMWSIPRRKYDNFRFDDDSTVLAMDLLDAQNRPATARWRIADGAVIDPLPVGIGGVAHRHADPQGRYACVQRHFEKGSTIDTFDRGLYMVQRMLGQRPRWPDPHHTTMELLDLKSGRPVGVFGFEYSGTAFLPDGSGFVAATDEESAAKRLRYYRLPPPRDWGWLVLWAMLPPIAFVLLARWLNRRRIQGPGARFVDAH